MLYTYEILTLRATETRHLHVKDINYNVDHKFYENFPVCMLKYLNTQEHGIHVRWYIPKYYGIYIINKCYLE